MYNEYRQNWKSESEAEMGSTLCIDPILHSETLFEILYNEHLLNKEYNILMKPTSLSKFIISIIVCESAGIVGSFFTISSIAGWYAGLVKPALNPPAWVFGPVWTTLYFMMGVALFLIWKSDPLADSKRRKKGVILFFIQLALNALWSIIFFGWHSPGWALADIVFLWLAIAATIISFYKISKPAAWLLAPYLLWVSFASYLNYAVWMLN